MKGSVIASIIVIILGTIVGASSINNLMNFDQRMLEKPEVQENIAVINQTGLSLLESCADTKASLLFLEMCKEEIMPELVDVCKDNYVSTTELCNDSRLKEFFVTINSRIEQKKQYVEQLSKELDDLQLETLEMCQFVNSEPNLSLCKLDVLNIVEFCRDKNNQDFTSCNDPRIDQILNKSPRQESDIFEFANNEMLDFINHCTTTKNERFLKSCAETAQQMIQMCNIDASVQACGDPRLYEIANYDTKQSQPSITQEDNTLATQDEDLVDKPRITNQIGTLSLSTNKITIMRDVMLEISGNVIDYKKGIPLILTVKNPNNELENLKTIVASDGSFKTYWIVNSNSTQGTYSIAASYNDNKIGSLEFDINGQDAPEVIEPSVNNEIKLPKSEWIHAIVDCIPSNDPMQFLVKVYVKNQDSSQHDTEVYVSADWDNVVQQTVLSYALLEFEPITLEAGEEKILEGMIQRWTSPSQERELECRVYIAWVK